ncbi:hypothetical protein L2827_01255 [Lactobacillus gasseri]|jgi:hypothetical protein|nr:hypothetical protein [Lactobacillus gasseri]MCZ3539013.1 hypothetical protein [Lactobacillus gasseri]MCZ3546204.1 hypothetical protein [Lactobacillus gasseri]MCZ3548089.1 hypothetical protein [Lactobacillus gasseri]MCZ3551291.1 hypothetical protein [Lactobacillus gasseri]
MKVRVSWDSPDYYQPLEDTYEDIEVDDNATEEEIERAVKETAFEHFEYSYKILPAKSNPDKKTFKDLIDSWRKDIKRRQNL